MLYTPLKFSSSFLIASIAYFFLGPVSYSIGNISTMLLCLLFYLCMSHIGYLLGVYFSLRVKANKKSHLFKISFWNVVLFAIFSNLIFNYVVAAQSFIPHNVISFFKYLLSGDVVGLGNLYYDSKMNSEGGKSLIMSVLFSAIGWGRFIFIPYVIWNWTTLNPTRKVISVLVALMPVLTGVSIGLNKPLFDTVLVFLLFAGIGCLLCSGQGNRDNFLRFRKLVKVSSFSVLLAIILFGNAMNSRGVTFDYIEANSPRGDISVSDRIPENSLSISLIMLGHYMFQGYYAFSLSLEQSFDSTYGFGHSPFLARQYNRLMGDDIADRTYQQKIDGEWANETRWHSAYSQFANDVHFVGVGFVILIIYFVMALTWVFATKYRMREFLYFLPVHGILVIFLPANNQVFGFADSLGLVFIMAALIVYRLVSRYKI